MRPAAYAHSTTPTMRLMTAVTRVFGPWTANATETAAIAPSNLSECSVVNGPAHGTPHPVTHGLSRMYAVDSLKPQAATAVAARAGARKRDGHQG